jgi:hypothetical protein
MVPSSKDKLRELSERPTILYALGTYYGPTPEDFAELGGKRRAMALYRAVWAAVKDDPMWSGDSWARRTFGA